MRLIYFSPHLDDAALSAGGWLHDQARAGMAVEIWTFLCGVPDTPELSDFARQMHAKWATTSAAHTVEVRRAEDRRAAARIGAKAVHFDFLDAIYRRASDGSWLYSEPVGAAVHPEDADLPARIAKAAASRLRPEDAVVCQLAIGNHIDHSLVRTAAELLRRPLRYAADIPYLLQHRDELPTAAAGLRSSVQPVSEAGLGAWLDAIRAYASQISTLYDSWELLEAAVRDYWPVDRGIRLWSVEAGLPGVGLDSGRNS